jgi:hypothetical protein
MGAHLIEGEFQSDKYPTTPRGKVPLSVKDTTAQDLLWEYAQRRRVVDAELSDDLETALRAAGYEPPQAVCFECQPSWNGRTTMRPIGPPTCTRCGKTCHGGHWSLRPATTTNLSAK